jgi:hypothetical protein
MRPDSRNRLEAFVAVVDEIETYSIFEKGDRMVECRIHEEDGQLVVAYDGPSTEQLNAVLLRLRLFLRRDDLSFARTNRRRHQPSERSADVARRSCSR